MAAAVPSAEWVKAELDRVAREADAAEKDLPCLIPLGAGLLTRAQQGDAVSQARIAGMTRNFIRAVELLLPADLAAAYVRRRCADGNLWRHVDFAPDYTIVPPWAEMGGGTVPPGATASQRAKLDAKFSHAEVMGFADAAVECPQLMTSILTFQRLIGDCIADVKGRLDPDEYMAGQAALLQEHWAHAGNFSKFVHAGFVATRPQGMTQARALAEMTQADADRMFQFLMDSRAFDFVTGPDNSPNAPKGLVFSCPAQPLLRELIVQRGSLMTVVGAVQDIMAEREPSMPGIFLHLLSKANGLIAEEARDIIRPGTPETFGMLLVKTHKAAMARGTPQGTSLFHRTDE